MTYPRQLNQYKAALPCVSGPVWTARTITSQHWRAITYGNGRYVSGGKTVAGANVRTAWSSDGGITWNNSATPPGMPAGGQGIAEHQLAFGNNVFVACSGFGLNALAFSNDGGDNWTINNDSGYYGANQIIFVNGKFCILRASANRLAMTSNGVGAPSSSTVLAADSYANIATDGGTKIMLVCTGGAFHSYLSVDSGASFTLRGNLPQQPAPVLPIGAYGNGTWVFAENTTINKVMYSKDDGATWLESTGFAGGNNQFSDIIFAQGVFLLIGAVGNPAGQKVYTSLDGITWNLLTNLFPANTGTSWQVAYDGNKGYAAVLNQSAGSTVAATGIC